MKKKRKKSLRKKTAGIILEFCRLHPELLSLLRARAQQRAQARAGTEVDGGTEPQHD